jgi:hypothetical protein
MVFCNNCGAEVVSAARFCPSCGKPVGTGGGGSIQVKQSLKEKWLDNYYRGTVKSDTGEIWNYDRGILTCQEGNQKGLKFTWTGSSLTCESKDGGSAEWTGTQLSFRFPEVNDVFYSYVWDESKSCFRNERGILRVNPHRYTSYVNWVYTKDVMKLAEGSDVKEGAATKFEILGDFPLPLVLVCTMYTRAQKLLHEAIAKSKLSFKRCGKLAIQSAATPLICPNCDPNLCISCQKSLGSSKYQGKICKNCGVRRALCVVCNDPLQGSKVEGFLCTDCGIGKLADNCCKMSVGTVNPFI